jgi:hypothetical protein
VDHRRRGIQIVQPSRIPTVAPADHGYALPSGGIAKLPDVEICSLVLDDPPLVTADRIEKLTVREGK